MKTVVGMFSDMDEAQRSFEDLMRLGLNPNDISIVTRSTEAVKSDRIRLSPIDAMDTGRISAAGPIASVLAQRKTGLVGTLRNAGVSAALAEHYAAAVGQGETLESVIVDDRSADRVVEVMKRHAARSGVGLEAKPLTQPTATTEHGGMFERAKEAVAEKLGRGPGARERETVALDEYIPVMREEVQIGKREVERGGVRASVRVTERPINEHIRLREEHVDIERRPVNRVPRADEPIFTAREIVMTERGEEAVVSKQVRIVEEIRLHKTVSEREQVITDKVRSTEVDIDQGATDRR
jgi:hypothetical protein